MTPKILNTMDLYTKNAIDCGRTTTSNYSTSFYSALKLLKKEYRDAVFAIYGFVRFADEIVDTFMDRDRRKLIEEFKIDVYRAIEQKMSLNPILHAFQWVVNSYHLEEELIRGFFVSMEMDLRKIDYTPSDYQTYVYGSSEVVGLMCLSVFYAQERDEYQRLKPFAKEFGNALQKINFLRDIKSDFEDRGRVYFPGIDFNHFTEEQKTQIEQEIEEGFEAFIEGIKNLKKGVKKGVKLAYRYFLVLLKKIRKTSAKELKDRRIRVSDWEKTWIWFWIRF